MSQINTRFQIEGHFVAKKYLKFESFRREAQKNTFLKTLINLKGVKYFILFGPRLLYETCNLKQTLNKQITEF